MCGLALTAGLGSLLAGQDNAVDPTESLSAGLIILLLLAALAWGLYFLDCRIEDLRRRLRRFNIMLMLLEEESRLASDPELSRSTRRLEYRLYRTDTPFGRARLAGRELAWLLGVTRGPSLPLTHLFAGFLLMLLVLMGIGVLPIADDPYNGLLSFEGNILLGGLAIILFLTLLLGKFCGVGVLQEYMRQLDRGEIRQLGSDNSPV